MSKIKKRNFIAKAVTKIVPQVIQSKKKASKREARAVSLRKAWERSA